MLRNLCSSSYLTGVMRECTINSFYIGENIAMGRCNPEMVETIVMPLIGCRHVCNTGILFSALVPALVTPLTDVMPKIIYVQFINLEFCEGSCRRVEMSMLRTRYIYMPVYQYMNMKVGLKICT